MKFTVLCAVAAQLVSAAVDIKSISQRSTGRIIPNFYIVELSKDSHFKRGFVSPHEELYHDLKRRGASWEVTQEYSDNLFTGAAVKLGSAADLVKLAEAAGVESVAPVRLYSAPKPVSRYVLRNTTNTTALKSTTHIMTGVDKLHAEGYFGQGITIGLIDTGIDYTHPSLGGAFGPGNKVIGGYDFVGDAYTGLPDSTPVPDPDPLDRCDGHGTHVAGIVGANPNNPWNISGVAHQSKINAYRVFGCPGSAPDNVIIGALLRAHADGNDVINLSLGAPSGWSESPMSVVANRIARAGRIVTASVGNDAQFGAWYPSAPATGLEVISVGSVDNTVVYQQNATVSNGRNITYQSLDALDIPDNLQLYATSSNVNVTADACEPLPDDTPDLSNRLVIIRRGTCLFANKLNNTAAKGGRYFLIYDNLDEPLYAITVGNYQVALITQTDGIFLVQQAIPQNMTISFPDSLFTPTSPTGGLISPYTAYGPTYDMYMEPRITAPGENIPSTWPVNMGSWAIISGTSMSAPLVAGAAALLLQIRGKDAATALTARTIFQNNAIPVMRTFNTSSVPTAAQQGAGLINAYKAIKSTGSLYPSELLLNDTTYFKGAHSLVVRNDGAIDITYTFTHVPAGSINTITGIEPIPGLLELINSAASVDIKPNKITVPPGSSASVNVTIEPPTNLNATQFPVYSGYIKATGSDNSTLHSTYLGVAARLKDMKIIDNTDSYFGNITLPTITDSLGNPIPSNGSTSFTLNGTDIPIVIFRLVAGSPMVRFDLINSGVDPATSHREACVDDSSSEAAPLKRSIWNRRIFDRAPTTESAVKVLGALGQIPYASRNSLAQTAETGGYYTLRVNQFANETAIPDGTYRILLCALKITGNSNQEEDYESWTSPKIAVRRG